MWRDGEGKGSQGVEAQVSAEACPIGHTLACPIGHTLRLPTVVIPGECGVSSTLRPLGSIIDASGILDPRLPPSLCELRRTSRGGRRLNVCSRSRDIICPSYSILFAPLKLEGAGNAGCALHPRSRVLCLRIKRDAHEHTGERRTLRHPLRNGFTAYIVLSPVSGLVVTVIPEKRELLKNLTPASRRQDHTTSPYAPVQSSAEQARPPHPIPTFSDDGRRPSSGMRRRTLYFWFSEQASEIFLLGGLDGVSLICPTEQSV